MITTTTARTKQREGNDDLLPRVLIPYDAPDLSGTERAVPVGLLHVLWDMGEGGGMTSCPYSDEHLAVFDGVSNPMGDVCYRCRDFECEHNSNTEENPNYCFEPEDMI